MPFHGLGSAEPPSFPSMLPFLPMDSAFGYRSAWLNCTCNASHLGRQALTGVSARQTTACRARSSGHGDWMQRVHRVPDCGTNPHPASRGGRPAPRPSWRVVRRKGNLGPRLRAAGPTAANLLLCEPDDERGAGRSILASARFAAGEGFAAGRIPLSIVDGNLGIWAKRPGHLGPASDHAGCIDALGRLAPLDPVHQR